MMERHTLPLKGKVLLATVVARAPGAAEKAGAVLTMRRKVSYSPWIRAFYQTGLITSVAQPPQRLA